ncbi:MAG: cupin domain-containing protein, partial [Candidatus Eremiobacterota bacterium]
DCWSPKIIGKINDYFVKIAKVKGDFTWHLHDDSDEVFIVHKGILKIDFRDGSAELKAGQMFVVEKGKEHKPYAENECHIILFEKDTVVNTGNIKNEFTKESVEWI